MFFASEILQICDTHPVFRNVLACALICVPLVTPAQTATPPADWRSRVVETLPLLGHRNWILIVDSAYPLQTSPGVETIDTGASLSYVLQFVLSTLPDAPHVRPDIFMDAELPFVPDQDAPGAAQYRTNIADLLRGYPIQSLPHDKIIATIDEAGKTFHVLVLKTNMTIPYSSVFIRLNCKYWSDEAEMRLRSKMAAGPR
jgi:L-fucose mutarotase/ribose pyranase (RbsD/FucU family)